MKAFLVLLFLSGSMVMAQTASVKDLPLEGDTTISIGKGRSGVNEFQITEGTAEISGDPEVLMKQARSSWKRACEDWKKELRELNKENQIISMTCNSPKCTRENSAENLCQSSGVYKVKTRVK